MALKFKTKLVFINLFTIAFILLVSVCILYFIVSQQIRLAAMGFLSDEFREHGIIFQRILDDPVKLKKEMDKQFTQVKMTYPIICRFYDDSGQLYVKSEGIKNVAHTEQKLILRALKQEFVAHTLKSEGPEGQYWCIIHKMVSPSGKNFIYEFGLEISHLARRVRQLRKYLLVAIPAITLLCLCGAYWIAHRSLKPLNEILSKLRQIRSATLDKRLPTRNQNDEFGHLTANINEMLAEIESSFYLIRDFTADAAHELRTPLARLLMMLERDLNRQLTIENARYALDQTMNECQHIKRLTDDLMLLARLDAKDVEGTPVLCDLVEIIRNLEEMWSEVCEHRNVLLEVNIKNKPLFVKGYPELLTRLLANLIDNALHYSPPERSIQLTGVRNSDHIQITVSDSGKGIPNDAVPRLFNRFYRVRSEKNASDKGTGLGLSICYKIVGLHRGSINVTSTIGEGTTFTIILPHGKMER